MEKTIKKLLTRLLLIPIVGRPFVQLFLLLFYLVLRLTTPISFWLTGLRRTRIGTLIVWVPPKEKAVMLEGIEFLQKCDSEMFQALTKKRRFIVYYIGKSNRRVMNAFGHVFGIHERYFQIGKQGVAMFLAQSIMISEAYPCFNQLEWKPEHGCLRRVLEWMHGCPFDPRVIEIYRKAVERWEKTYECVDEHRDGHQ